MRTTPRRRWRVSPRAARLLPLLGFEYSVWRDAYVLRRIGEWRGPVLQVGSTQRQLPPVPHPVAAQPAPARPVAASAVTPLATPQVAPLPRPAPPVLAIPASPAATQRPSEFPPAPPQPQPISPPVTNGRPSGPLIVATGLRDLGAASMSDEALAVLATAPRLRRAGITVPDGFDEGTASLYLYESLCARYGDDAHARHHALIRNVVSCTAPTGALHRRR